MKNTYFTEATNMEVVLNSHQNDYIRFNEKIRRGEQWIEYFQKYNPKALEIGVFIKPVDADYYDFDMEEL